MLQAGSERPLHPAAGSMWVPGMSPQPSPSARALEIARRRDEMLGMLRGLPESEYELSLTDLVEKTAGALPLPTPPKEAGPSTLGRPAGLSDSGRQAAELPAARTERRGSSRRRGDSGRSSSDSVLLNFYMPRSFTRSFTAPRSGAAARAAVLVPDEESNKRERDNDAVKCWPMPWDRRWRKSSRRDHAGEPAATLEAAGKHSAMGA